MSYYYTNFIIENKRYSIRYDTFEEAEKHLKDLYKADAEGSVEVYKLSVTKDEAYYTKYLPDGTKL